MEGMPELVEDRRSVKAMDSEWAVAEPPGSVGAAGGPCRQMLTDAVAALTLQNECARRFHCRQTKARSRRLIALVEAAQDRRGLAEAEVAPPPNKVCQGQRRGQAGKADAVRAPRQLPDPSLRTGPPPLQRCAAGVFVPR